VNKFTRGTALIVATLLLAACGIFGGDDDVELEPKELVKFSSKLQIKKVWSTKIGGSSEFLLLGLRPTGDGNRLYVASQDGKVLALDPASGAQHWKTDLETDLSAGVAAADGIVVVVSRDGYAIVLTADTGNEMWRVFIGGEALAQPLILENVVVLQTIDNRLRALSRFDGKLRWQLEQTAPALTVRGASSPIAVGTQIIAGFDNGRLLAIDADSGDIQWDSMLALPTGRSDLARLSDIDGTLAVVGQDLYAAGFQGRIASIAVESGQVLWSREISSYVGMAADWSSVYTIREGGEVVALSRRGGTDNWRNDSLLRRDPTLPIPFHTTVAVGDFEGYVHFFSNLDGKIVARIRFGKDAISSNPVVVAGRLYVQSDNGSIAAYEVVEDTPRRTVPDIADDS
jgi:outer membrane protein assembly factor BamB